MKKTLVVIQGPTASGKTALGVELAKKYKSCVISADSRQFYKEMSIGTAKPTLNEMDNVPHFFVDSNSITDELSSAKFEKEALIKIEELFKLNDVLFLVGGSGMYIDALCNGLDNIPTSKEVKAAVERDLENHGLDYLVSELKNKDLDYYNEVDLSNPMRVVRAIEVIRLTGQKYSILRKANKPQRDFEVKRFVINHERVILYDRINRRVDLMIENGLLDEVNSLVKFRDLNVLRTVGYSELFDFIDGKCTFQEAVDKIKQNTRRYAKRQLTWFRRHQDTIWLKSTDLIGMVDEISSTLD